MSVTTNVTGQLQNLRANQDIIVTRLSNVEAEAKKVAGLEEQIATLTSVVEQLQKQLDAVHSDLDAISA